MKLNIGAGNRPEEGFKSVDIDPETYPDYLTDLEKDDCLKEIEDDSVDEVIMSHIFEHISNIHGFMKELYRVCKNEALVYITCPYWSHHTAVEDPTHVRFMTEKSMMYFDRNATGSDGRQFCKDYDFKTEKIEMHPTAEYRDLPLGELKDIAGKQLNVVSSLKYTLKIRK